MRPLAVSIALACCAAVARADPPGLTAPLAPAPSEGSYRLQTAATDLAAIGLGLLSHYDDSGTASFAAAGMYAAGSPIVHLFHHHPGRAAASLALRVGLPLVLGGLGMAATSNDCDGCELAGLGGLVVGLTLGAVAASAIDIGYLSRGEDRAPDRPIPIAPSSAQPSVEPRTVRVGLAFAF